MMQFWFVHGFPLPLYSAIYLKVMKHFYGLSGYQLEACKDGALQELFPTRRPCLGRLESEIYSWSVWKKFRPVPECQEYLRIIKPLATQSSNNFIYLELYKLRRTWEHRFCMSWYSSWRSPLRFSRAWSVGQGNSEGWILSRSGTSPFLQVKTDSR